MKKQSISPYEKQLLLENTAAVLFSILLTALLLVNMESILELANGLFSLNG